MSLDTATATLLCTHPDPLEARRLTDYLSQRGYRVHDLARLPRTARFAPGVEVRVAIVGLAADSVRSMPMDALSAIRSLRARWPAAHVLMLVPTSASLALCCKAVSLGAKGFVEYTPGEVPEDLLERVEQQLADYERQRRQEQQDLEVPLSDQNGLAGQSGAMQRLLLRARRAARVADAPIMIHGESGTGKQLLAEAVHRMDPKRRGKAFLSVNCSAITGTLAESALFGHVKGAYTGATEARAGYFRSADGGTLMLDEISELDVALQPKLLRVLQDGLVLPVGADREVPVDVRVIAASNRDLAAMVEDGGFRLDLYERLNVIRLRVPPLRERLEDIPLLVGYFIRKYRDYYPPGIESVDHRVYEVLRGAVGRGNVRELENLVRRTLAFKVTGHRLELSDLPEEVLQRAEPRRDPEALLPAELSRALARHLCQGQCSLAEVLELCERDLLREAIEQSGVSRSRLADRLGISRRTFYNKLKRHNL